MIWKIGQITEQDVQNEVRVLETLCSSDNGKFLVKVFQHKRKILSVPHATLPWELQDICIIDMELCGKNLHHEIEEQHITLKESIIKMQSTSGTSESDDSKAVLADKVKQIMIILEDILQGLEFIHSQSVVHRDLKPENILLSIIDQRWKLADFGSSAEGTSKRLRITDYSRGTGSYRCPELLQDGLYNNKADIWAFGCVAYELCTKTRAFTSDWDITSFALGCAQNAKCIFDDTIQWPEFRVGNAARYLVERCVDLPLTVAWKDRPCCEGLLSYMSKVKLALMFGPDILPDSIVKVYYQNDTKDEGVTVSVFKSVPGVLSGEVVYEPLLYERSSVKPGDFSTINVDFCISDRRYNFRWDLKVSYPSGRLNHLRAERMKLFKFQKVNYTVYQTISNQSRFRDDEFADMYIWAKPEGSQPNVWYLHALSIRFHFLGDNFEADGRIREFCMRR